MATDGSVEIAVDLTKKEFEKGISSVKSDLKSLGSSSVSATSMLDGISKGLKSMGSSLTKAGAMCSVFGAVVIKTFKSAADKALNFIDVYESARTIFEKRLGSSGADDMYESLLSVAKSSKYAQEYIVSAGQTLVAMGVSAKNTSKYVQVATDAMTGMGKSGAEVQSMAELFGKMSMQTNLYNDDLNQMVTNGIRVFDILAKKYGTTTSAIKEMAAEGEITSADFEYLMDVLSGNVQGMEEFSIAGTAAAGKTGTLSGALDSLNSAFRSFALNILGANINAGQTENYEKMIDVVGTLNKTITNVGDKFKFLGDWVGKALDSCKSALDSFNNTLNSTKPETLEKIAKAALGLTVAGPTLIVAGRGINFLGDSFSGLSKGVGIFKSAGNGIKSMASKCVGSLPSVVSTIGSTGKAFKTFGKEVGSGVTTIFSGGVFDKIGGFFKSGFSKIGTALATLGSKMLIPLQALGGKISALLAPIGNVLNAFGSKIGAVFSKIGGVLSSAFPNVTAGLSKIAGAFGGALQGILGKLGSFATSFLPIFSKAFGITAVVGLVVAGLGLLQSNFGEQLNNILTMVTTQGPMIITNLVNGIVSKLPDLIAQGATLLNNLLNAIIANLPAIISGGMQIIATLVSSMAAQLPTLIPTVIQLIMTIVQSIIENLPVIIEAGIQLLVSFIQGIVNAIPQLIEMLPTIIETICNVITEQLPNILNAGITILVSLIEGLVNAIPQLVAMLPQIITTIINFVVNNLPTIIDAGIKILIALINGIANAIPQLIRMLPEIITTIVKTLAQNLPQILAAGVEILTSLIAGIGSMLASLGSAAWDIITSIADVITQLPGKALEWGKDMIQGFIDGIKNMISNVGDAVSGIADKVKSFLHFSRPDKGPLRDYEKWMPDMVEGLSKTLKSSAPELYRATEDMADKIASGLDISSAYQQLQDAVQLETGRVTAQIGATTSAGRDATRTITNNNGNNINNTQNFYSTVASPYEQQKEAKQQLRRLAYGL